MPPHVLALDLHVSVRAVFVGHVRNDFHLLLTVNDPHVIIFMRTLCMRTTGRIPHMSAAARTPYDTKRARGLPRFAAPEKRETGGWDISFLIFCVLMFFFGGGTSLGPPTFGVASLFGAAPNRGSGAGGAAGSFAAGATGGRWSLAECIRCNMVHYMYDTMYHTVCHSFCHVTYTFQIYD